MARKSISMREVAKHNTKDDCWLVIYDKVYNMTPFLDEHPGGVNVILENAGKDATQPFESIHSKGILAILPKKCYVGDIDKSTIESSDITQITKRDLSSLVPPIDQMLNIYDFQHFASKVMTKDGWDYYASGADDEITLRENQMAFSRIWFRPRVLVDVSKINTKCKILGYESSFPVYVTATALGKLAHSDGELAITRACYNENIIQMIATLASNSIDEMYSVSQPNQTLFFQLYVNQDRKKTKEMILHAMKLGCKALFITVDAPQLGRRERDMRNKFNVSKKGAKRQQTQFGEQYKDKEKDKSGGVAKSLSTFIDPTLNWNDLPWFQDIINSFYNETKHKKNEKYKNNKMKIVLKGIQCGEDAILAYNAGMDGIVVSNHGGRQLDYARSGIEVLIEVMDSLKSINYDKNKFSVLMDGGVRRGTDIFKALALGADGIGIGRPALYGLATYGQEGVERVIQLLKHELETTMQMCGTPCLSDIKRDMVITKNIGDHHVNVPSNLLAKQTYQPLPFASKL